MRRPPDKPWYKCRRTLVALYGMTLLFALGLFGKADVAGAMATIVIAVAGANSAQAVFVSRTSDANSQATPPST